MLRLIANSLLLLGCLLVALPLDAQTSFRPYDPPRGVRLPDRGGTLGVDVDEVEVKDERGTFVWLRLTENPVLFEAERFKRGATIVSIDRYLFRTYDDLSAYVRSIPEDREFVIAFLTEQGEMYSLSRTMPTEARLRAAYLRALNLGMYRLRCQADNTLDGKPEWSSPCRILGGRTPAQARQEEIDLLRGALTAPHSRESDVRKKVSEELRKLESAK